MSLRGGNKPEKGREVGRISLSSMYPSIIVNLPLLLSRHIKRNYRMN
jgi:hypothetical protein